MKNRELLNGFPEHIDYPVDKKNDWKKFPLGVNSEGDEVVWNIQVDPNVLLAGGIGSGRSTVQRNLLFHCVQNPDTWRVVAIDLKGIELKEYAEHTSVVEGVATNVEGASELLLSLRDELTGRYAEMEEQGCNTFEYLESRPRATLVIIDEVFPLLVPSEPEKEDASLVEARTSIVDNISAIARLGRAAGFHFVIATQRPDAVREVLRGETNANITARYAIGILGEEASQSVLGSDSAARLSPDVPVGRGTAVVEFEETELQGYYSSLDMMKDWVENNRIACTG